MTKKKSIDKIPYVEISDQDLYALRNDGQKNQAEHQLQRTDQTDAELLEAATAGGRRLDQLKDAESQLKQIRKLRDTASFDDLLEYIEATPFSPLLIWLLIESASLSATKGGVVNAERYAGVKARVLAAWKALDKRMSKVSFAKHWEYKLREENKIDKTIPTVSWHQIAKKWLPQNAKGKN